ncbi:MAG: DUF6691 family protein [Aquabacterium sp.]|jgi:hypothetical protein
MTALMGLIVGLLFGLGLAVSGMTDPLKVQNFLDVTGTWDPSLALVMGGAVVVTFIGYRLAWKRGQPWLDQGFHLPTATAIDRKLVVGAAMFGVGWGLAGYCPGPALATVALGNTEVWWFVPAMLAGGWVQRWQAQRSA